MMLKFAHMDWAKCLSKFLGGVHNAGVLHRIGAVITFGYFGFPPVQPDQGKTPEAFILDEIYLW